MLPHDMYIKGITQPPYKDNFDPWYTLVRATVQHLVDRYGLQEIQQWSFEVWNELWGMPYPSQYLSLYNASARAVKSVHSSLKVKAW